MLFIRSLFNLLLVFVVAGVTKQKLLPTQPKLQIGAFICLGLSLLLIFTAYQYISAGSVSTLQRLDIPLLAVLAMHQKFSLKKLLLSVLAFLLVAVLVVYTSANGENPVGYFLVLAGVALVAVNTLIQKQIAAKENIVAIMLVGCLSSICWGGLRCWQGCSSFQNMSPAILLAIFGLAVVNLTIFYLVNELYKKHPPEFVRYPYLIAAFGTMCVEMLMKQRWQSPVVIAGNTAILLVFSVLVTDRLQKRTRGAW
ncbi:hypothetical protein [Niabella drilacis]|uniref:EamA-like transporter family protein n=1 Tax=Niabella drilacis (strain DSM 25811 / CCM 8410 / CCUG 62505 / LMG 26954 / E90) TaxID=1285928 RepID=A0A1G7BYE9_NIADE|nr:hypothetical protein [Niabella drilacis]SDE31590.1 hypothetical protein SAMN04487894_13426 [Niabella drilacis]